MAKKKISRLGASKSRAKPPGASVGRSKTFAKRRADLRDDLWPDCSGRVWFRKTEKGFTTVPRTLSLILRLIKHLSTKGDASRVYLDLWLRAFDEGFVEILNEDDCAYCAGYSGTRGTRTWHHHVAELERLRFIATKPRGNRTVGFVLIINPHIVVRALKESGKRGLPEEWWTAFAARAKEIGAVVPGSD